MKTKACLYCDGQGVLEISEDEEVKCSDCDGAGSTGNLLGEFLRSHRVSADLSQSYVARRLGYSSPQFVSNWERGLSVPPMNVLPKLERLYRFSGNELIEILVFEYRRELERVFEQKVKL
jgi:DNA-binding transcriptional regulator YiaG